MRVAAGVFLLAMAGCEQFFTYSPVESFQRPLENLTLEQQIQYGKDALAGGNRDAMRKAYDVLIQKTDSAEAMYVASLLGTELSGMSGYIFAFTVGAAILPTSSDWSSLQGYVDDNGADVQGYVEAVYILIYAQALGWTLESEDYLTGGFGLLVDAALQPDGSFDFGAMDALKLALAKAFINQQALTDILDGMSHGGLYYLLTGFRDYVNAF